MFDENLKIGPRKDIIYFYFFDPFNFDCLSNEHKHQPFYSIYFSLTSFFIWPTRRSVPKKLADIFLSYLLSNWVPVSSQFDFTFSTVFLSCFFIFESIYLTAKQNLCSLFGHNTENEKREPKTKENPLKTRTLMHELSYKQEKLCKKTPL